jgi:uncharacterized protein (TIGR03086 family)
LPAVATVEQLETVLGVVEPLVAAVGTDQWSGPTPCGEWDVRALVGHVVAANDIFAGVLTGTPLPEMQARRPADPLGDDPDAAYRESAAAVVSAFRTPGALERPVTIPFGTMPGAGALDVRIVDVLVHGWDLARATGRTVSFPDEIVEQAIEFSRPALDLVPADRSPFAPSRPVAEDAPPLDRLVALLGREPH